MIAALICAPVAVPAAAPQQKNQAPGFYRLMLGDFEITALSDGTFPMEIGKVLIDIPPTELDAALRRNFLQNPAQTSVNGFLINTGAKLVLIDTGAGVLLGPSLGRLVANLQAAGYRPEQVDEIYITHMHGDHIGGLLSNRKPAFPNAIVRASQREADFWLAKSSMGAAPAHERQGFAQAAAALKPYIAAGHFKSFDGETELTPGIRAVPAGGHTPGHTIYVAESKGEKILIWGDTMHVAAVQFPDPAVAIRYDHDSAAAVAIRAALFADAAAHGYWIAGAHLSFPGIGHLRSAGRGYEFVPANYTVP
jgi:glyoxylase-like metal-dependent hydrolase (beta-lactamase superfamily II)